MLSKLAQLELLAVATMELNAQMEELNLLAFSHQPALKIYAVHTIGTATLSLTFSIALVDLLAQLKPMELEHGASRKKKLEMEDVFTTTIAAVLLFALSILIVLLDSSVPLTHAVVMVFASKLAMDRLTNRIELSEQYSVYWESFIRSIIPFYLHNIISW